MRKKKYAGIFCTHCESICLSNDEMFYCYCEKLPKAFKSKEEKEASLPKDKEERKEVLAAMQENSRRVWEKWRNVQITISSVPTNRPTLRNVLEVLQA